MKIKYIRRIGDIIYCEDDQDNGYEIPIPDLDRYLIKNECYDWSISTADQEYTGKMQFDDWLSSRYAAIDILGYLEDKRILGEHNHAMTAIDDLIKDFKNLR